MSNALVMPGYRIAEYRLIIPLSEALQQTVMQVRKELHERYRIPIPFELKPSLTILHCHAYEGMEAKLAERMQQVATRNSSFKVELQNFAAYPSHTIYLHVPTRSPFNDLCKELKVVKSLTKVPDHDAHFINEPHLLIAQKLKPFQFTRMWMDCEHTQFTGRFMANSMVLMKRSAVNNQYEEVRRFEFASLAHSVKQGSLFG
ncbi:MAG TPA: 2'-5' RNA ligase family protein [Flavisolibacter sp.]|jgi:2'-5' RNA ligase|nr:2'-5' RNA ligase family protein [Flavisolibacter sp.]